jgi:hypothetical protein
MLKLELCVWDCGYVTKIERAARNCPERQVVQNETEVYTEVASGQMHDAHSIRQTCLLYMHGAAIGF